MSNTFALYRDEQVVLKHLYELIIFLDHHHIQREIDSGILNRLTRLRDEFARINEKLEIAFQEKKEMGQDLFKNSVLKERMQEMYSLIDEQLKKIIEWSIGGNPRSIKRLINSISLIKIFSSKKKQTSEDQSETKITEDEEKLLLFSLLCLQIAYPRFYDLLQKQPNITAWDKDFAFTETMGKEENVEQFAKEFKNAKRDYDFDEIWEQTIYRICYTDSRLKTRANYISQFLSFIKDVLLEEHQDEVGVIIANILSQTAVTSVSAQAQIVLPEREGRGKRRFLENFETWLVDMERQKGSDEDEIKIVKDLHETMKKELPEATHKFATEWTVYLNNHRFSCIFK